MTVVKESRVTVSRFRYWLPRAVIAIFAPLLLLAFIEGTLRIAKVGYSSQLMESCTVHGQPYSCYNLFFAAPFFPPGVIKTPQFYTVADKKPSGTYRIFIFGESAAEGDPDFAYGFARYLEVMLRNRLPGHKFEIVNTGMVAINSNVIRLIARDLSNYKPDFYIVYAGSNEVVGPYGPGTVLTPALVSRPAIRASIFLNSTRIGQQLASAGAQRSEWRGMEMFLKKQIRADSPGLGSAYNNFSANLQDIVSFGTAGGAHVLLSTVATNLKDCAPFGSLHRDGLSEESLHLWNSLVQEGAAKDALRTDAEALKLYLAADRIDDQNAELQFRIAQCQWRLGDYAAAKESFARARDLDVLRFRADSHINQIIRSVASTAGSDVRLMDTEALFAEESRNGIVGSELFYDHVHLTPLGSYLLARSAFQKIVSVLPPEVRSSMSSPDPPSEAECERLLALTRHDRARVAQEMVERLTRPPFTTQLTHPDQINSLMLSASGSTEQPQETLQQYQWAIAQAPNDLTLHYKFGFFLFDFNPEAAAQELIRARPSDDFPVYLPDGTRVQ